LAALHLCTGATSLLDSSLSPELLELPELLPAPHHQLLLRQVMPRIGWVVGLPGGNQQPALDGCMGIAVQQGGGY
jgi:hypothetical protein